MHSRCAVGLVVLFFADRLSCEFFFLNPEKEAKRARGVSESQPIAATPSGLPLLPQAWPFMELTSPQSPRGAGRSSMSPLRLGAPRSRSGSATQPERCVPLRGGGVLV